MSKKIEQNLENDLAKIAKNVSDYSYANALYASLCNVIWVHRKTKKEW